MSKVSISLEQLKLAVAIKEQIAGLEAKLGLLFGGDAPASGPAVHAAAASPGATAKKSGRGGRRSLSAEAKARIVAAQKERWAKFRAAKSKTKENGKAAPGKKAIAPAGKKRVISAEGRARLAAAARARWERFRAAKNK